MTKNLYLEVSLHVFIYLIVRLLINFHYLLYNVDNRANFVLLIKF